MLRQFEKIVFFLQGDYFAVGRIESAVGAPIFFGEKRLFLGGIKTLVSLL